ncbi:MAG: DUF1844 domain-containing protein [Myxococcaceae bacterium]|jgi:hypothetical protein|nr:DUF1844 domain-containing protein [Myxococcaceae bacterium]MCA3013943.1 DUF1844 domain-containing protein [Myxococcaceae bacterium]
MSARRGETFVMKGAGTEAVSFSTFVLGLASTALIHLGDAPNPETGAPATNLVLARQTLELIELLRQKTHGNLSSDEEQLFASLLTDLRLRYVQKQGR